MFSYFTIYIPCLNIPCVKYILYFNISLNLSFIHPAQNFRSSFILFFFYNTFTHLHNLVERTFLEQFYFPVWTSSMRPVLKILISLCLCSQPAPTENIVFSLRRLRWWTGDNIYSTFRNSDNFTFFLYWVGQAEREHQAQELKIKS